jgi:predicted nucleotidyltransferase
MRVNLRENIAGQPVAKIREFLRRAFDGSWGLSYAAKKLRVDLAAAQEVVAELRKRGYVRTADSISGEDHWTNTMQGNAFSHASGAKPLLRASADQRLKEFLARVEEVGRNPYYLYRVRRAVLFGSYLSSQDRINDIDLLVSIVPKEKDGEKQSLLEQRRTEEALRQGRSLSTFIDQISWPLKEVLKYLKARSRSISLHTDERILKYGKSKVIYTDRS